MAAPTTINNPFENAATFTDETQQFVSDQIEYARTWADTGLSSAISTIGALAGIAFIPPDGALPLPDLVPVFEQAFDLPSVNVSNFGNMTPWSVGPAPDVDDLPSVGTVTIPTFVPSIAGLTIPEAPAPISVATPGNAPLPPNLVYPNAPTIGLPDTPGLSNITIPVFSAPQIPVYDPAFPEFEGSAVNAVLTWVEPTYSREIIDSSIAQIQTFLAGGSGIDPVVENAIMERGRDREDRIVMQNEQQAISEFANRGYTEPPGLLVKRLDNLREDGVIKKLGLQRELVIQIREDELTNLRFATQQGIAAEQLFIQLFLAATGRVFETARMNVQWMLDLYNLQVTLYNARMQEVQVRSQVYATQLQGYLAEVQIYEALVEAEKSKATINLSLVEAYKAEIQSRIALVSIYEAQIRAVAVQAGVYATDIEAYKGTIDAYSAQVNADKVRFDAYEARIRGEVAKSSIIESEARAYTAQIEGIGIGVRAETAVLQGEVAKITAQLDSYRAELAATVAQTQNELSAIQANVQGYTADTQRFIAQGSVEEAKSKVELAAWEVANRTSLSYFEAQVAKFRVDLEALTQQAGIALSALQASGELGSTIGAGALAAMHIGATMSGSSSVSASGNLSETFQNTKSCSTTNQSSISYQSESAVLLACPFA